MPIHKLVQYTRFIYFFKKPEMSTTFSRQSVQPLSNEVVLGRCCAITNMSKLQGASTLNLNKNVSHASQEERQQLNVSIQVAHLFTKRYSETFQIIRVRDIWKRLINVSCLLGEYPVSSVELLSKICLISSPCDNIPTSKCLLSEFYLTPCKLQVVRPCLLAVRFDCI